MLRNIFEGVKNQTMEFKDNLRNAREAAGLTQKQLADLCGITPRSIQHYELGSRKPQHIDTVQKIATALNVPIEQLTGTSGMYVIDAYEKGGAKAARDVDALLTDITGLFAGGELDESEKEGIMAAITQAYWQSKQINQKYTPKKYLKEDKS